MMLLSPTVIKTTGLYYQFSHNVKVLADINLQVERGYVYGFLGPNGSGKTTTIRLLLGLLKGQKGTIEIFEQELKSNRINILKKIGSLLESPSLYGHLSAQENLEVYRSVYGASKARVVEVLRMVGLDDTGHKPIKNYSLGMKQRLAIALALLPNPELLILDEPTNGLDPNGIIELRELIKNLNEEEGITLLISSHILAEVEKMVSHIGIIVKGQMVFQGSLRELNQLGQKGAKLSLHTSDNEAALRILQDYKPEMLSEMLTVSCQDTTQVAAINRRLLNHNLDVYLLQPQKNDLEQLFMDLTSPHA